MSWATLHLFSFSVRVKEDGERWKKDGYKDY